MLGSNVKMLFSSFYPEVIIASLVAVAVSFYWHKKKVNAQLNILVKQSSYKDEVFDVGNANGQKMAFPPKFKGTDTAVAFFVVPTDVANNIMNKTGFKAAEIFPGKCILTMTFVHYTETDCGAYNEISCAFFVKKEGLHKQSESSLRIPYLSTWFDIIMGNAATHIFMLPVTQSQSRECGQQMWGFPKTVEEIRFEKSKEQLKYSLHQKNGDKMIEFTAERGGTSSISGIKSPVYTLFRGSKHLSFLSVAYEKCNFFGGKGKVQLFPSCEANHPLRQLGLPKSCVFSATMGEFNFEMSAPIKL